MGDDQETVPDSGPLDRAAISKVARRVEIDGVRLGFCHTELNTDIKSEAASRWPHKAFIDGHAHLAARVGTTSFRAEAHFLARMKSGSEPESDDFPEYDPDDLPDVEIAAGFVLDYLLRRDDDADELTDDDLESFCEFNATYNAWPYWRELAQSMSTRMGLAPLAVPVLRVPRIS